MVALRIVAERAEAVVTARSPASVRVEWKGWTGTVPPIVSVSAEQAGTEYPWVSIEASSAPGSTSGVVTFDPTKDPRPRPGTYPVVVSVADSGQRVSTTVRFVVKGNPCAHIRPQPSFTWDPRTNSATVKVKLWSCGDVDVDVDWSVRLKGRRLEVQPATLTVFADGGVVDATLTIKIPEGVDFDTRLDLESLCADKVERFSVVPARLRRSWLRRHGLRVVMAGAIIGLAVPVVAGLVDDQETIVSPPSDTADVVTGTSANPPTTDIADTTDAPTGEPANHDPVAFPDEQTGIEDAMTTIDVLANDRDDDGDGLALLDVFEPSNGTAQIVGNAIEYTPAPDFTGPDSFSYALGDGRGGLADGAVTVLVEGQPDAPIALDDAVTALEGQPQQLLDVLANDTDVDGDELTIERITQPDNGKADLVDDRTLHYFPGGSTSDQLTYVATDGSLESEPATVEITIQPSLVDADQTVFEGAGTTGPVPFRLTSPARGVIRGTYRTVDGNARSGDDYVESTGPFEFRFGEQTVELAGIEILDDDPDDNETFDIELTVEHPGGVVDTATITVTIDDTVVD